MPPPRPRSSPTYRRHARWQLERRDSSGGGYNNVSRVNLFYILIAILAAFALVSLLNFSRLRRRRRRIINEARRLGLVVPGMEGYIPMRDRQGFVKSDGWKVPAFWEITRSPTGASGVSGSEPRREVDGVGVIGTEGVGAATAGGGGVGSVGDVYGGGVEGGIASASGSCPAEGAGLAGAAVGAEPVPSNGDVKVKVEEEWVETADGREVATDRIDKPMVEIGQRATLPEPAIEAITHPAAPAEQGQLETYGARDLLEMPPLDDITPVSIIPEPEEIVLPAKPLSSIPYFPNFVSYRKEQFEVRPPRFENTDSLSALSGESVDVVFAIRMPTEPIEVPAGVDEEDLEVVREWAGLELGVTKVAIR